MNRRRHVQHLLSAYIDGDLSHARRMAVEAHLIDCPACARELDRWRAMLRLVSSHAAVRCPIDCAEAVLRRLEWEDSSPVAFRPAPHRSLLSLSRPLALAAAAALLVGGLWLGAGRYLGLPSLPGPARVIATAHAPRGGGPGWKRPDDLQAAMAIPESGAQVSAAGMVNPVQPLRVHAPDRLQEAFGRSDSLILASDFSEDDR